VTALLERAFLPSSGKVIVDVQIDLAAKRFSTVSGVPLPILTEIVERQIKPQMQFIRDGIDDITGLKYEK